MSIIFDSKTEFLIQGITGAEGSRTAAEMISYQTKVVAGVTPGKGGKRVHGIPVFNSVRQALVSNPALQATLLTVPPAAVLDAGREALECGIKTLVILTENVPMQDSATLIALGKLYQARLIGPGSVGVICPGRVKCGSIGGARPERFYAPGKIGVVSKSGGMTAEICGYLSQAGIGQSTALGIGGDYIIGTSFVEALLLFEADAETQATVIFGEIGGVYENEVALAKQKGLIKKDVVALIAGEAIEGYSQDVRLGHAGAFIEGDTTKASVKKRILRSAGIAVAENIDDLPKLLGNLR